MGACGSANSVAVVKAQPAAPKPKFRGHRLQDVPLSPCASWQGPDLGARISRPDRSLHDEHVQRLEHFLECVEQQPKALDKLITRRRRAAKVACCPPPDTGLRPPEMGQSSHPSHRVVVAL
ncbi:unnamed protein product [Effrenium voratum]|uniref:Uncharacterized protein n=1 Tax=Effrenium voratum TaxID=2562239 RepID=A0AA36JJ02_9DINO|nr:unnamed protein product [Effrenium voratum]CAJ1406481.1 unnamed protein product [Effrenium voratum]